jgi:hypothetical protein
MVEQSPGWRDTSCLACFEIGHIGLWHATITWKPEPVLSEVLGAETGLEDRRLAFKREWRPSSLSIKPGAGGSEKS